MKTTTSLGNVAKRPRQVLVGAKWPTITERPMPDLSKGLCRNHPEPDLWFTSLPSGANREVNAAKQAKVERAKAVCGDCPVTVECLKAGAGEAGIWGGLTKEERAALRHRRGRPPKKPRVNHGLGNGPSKGDAA